MEVEGLARLFYIIDAEHQFCIPAVLGEDVDGLDVDSSVAESTGELGEGTGLVRHYHLD